MIYLHFIYSCILIILDPDPVPRIHLSGIVYQDPRIWVSIEFPPPAWGGEMASIYIPVNKKIRVSDPYHFDLDPDPDYQIHIWVLWIRILGSTFRE